MYCSVSFVFLPLCFGYSKLSLISCCDFFAKWEHVVSDSGAGNT